MSKNEDEREYYIKKILETYEDPTDYPKFAIEKLYNYNIRVGEFKGETAEDVADWIRRNLSLGHMAAVGI